MEGFNALKKMHYGEKVVTITENGVINFDPDSLKEVVGAEKMTYDEYLNVQMRSMGKIRSCFQACYFNTPMEFKGQLVKLAKGNVCFDRIYISGMYPDGEMFDGKEDHVWMKQTGFETAQIGDCFSFFAEVYPYVKTRNGKLIDYALKNPENIKKIESYELPSDDDLIMQQIDQINCETCFLSEQCNRMFCILGPKKLELLKKQMFNIVKPSSNPKDKEL